MTTKRLELIINERGGLSAKRSLDAVARAGRDVARSARQMRQGTRQGQQGLRDLDGQAQRTTRSLGGLGRVLTVAAVGAGVRAIAQTADAYTSLHNRLSVVTETGAELAAVQAELFDQAKDLHQPIKGVTEIYQRFAVATDGLALSHRELLEFTGNLQQAISLSGRSAEETRGALVQLGQGMATNFQAAGQELRSLQEGAPELAKAIAEAAGGSAGELLAMAQAGKITRELVVRAVTDMGVTLDEQWGKRIPPLADGWQDLGTSITKVIGEVDRATGVTRSLGGALSSVGDELEELIPDLTDTVNILGELGAFRGIFARIFEGAAFEGSVTNLQFMNLMLAGIVDRLVAVGTIGASSFQGLKSIFGGRGSTQAERDAFVQAIETTVTGVGAATQGVLDSIASRGAAKLGPGSSAPDPLAARVGGAARPPSTSAGDKGKSFSDIMGELRRENELLQMGNHEREIAQSLDTAIAQSKGRLSDHQRDVIEHQLQENQLLEVAKQSIDDRLKLELEAMEKEREQAEEISRIMGEREARGKNEAGSFRGFSDLSVGGQFGSLQGDFANQQQLMAQEQMEEFRTIGENLGAIFGPGGVLEQGLGRVGGRLADVVGQSIAFGRSWEDTGQAIKVVGQTIIAEVISGIIQTTVQMGIQAATASSLREAAKVQTITNSAEIAAATAPAAAAQSLATGGANGIGAATAILGAAALAATTFAIGAAAFREGGYTGDAGTAEVAGLVHGQEFVVNAEATRRNRDVLEALNAGARLGGGGGLTVNVIDQAGGVEFQTRQVDEGTVEVIARRLIANEVPGLVASNIRSPHGDVARAITETTTASRTRG